MANTPPREIDNEASTVNSALEQPTLAVDLERANIDQLIATAHKFPRSVARFVNAIDEMACYNEEAAQNCVYSLPRGGKPIIGPSIGFANILAQAWGNNRIGARITYVDRKDKVVMAEGAFLDLQTNSQSIAPVQRRIVDKNGRIYNDDMIIVTGQAAASIARRNSILHAIPRALWIPAFNNALRIVRGDASTFAEHKAKALESFHLFGVKAELVYGALGIKGEPDLTLDHIAAMRGMFAALRDGSETVETMFDPRRMTGTGFEQVGDPLQDEAESAAGRQEEGGEKPKDAGKTATAKPEPAKPEPAKAEKAAAKPKPQAKAKGKDAEKEPEPDKDPKPPAEPTQQQAEQPAQASGGEQTTVTTAPRPRERAVAETAPEPATAQPTTPEEYEAHANAYIDAATAAAELENRWKGERGLRTNCNVVEEVFSRTHKRYSDKLASLRSQ